MDAEEPLIVELNGDSDPADDTSDRSSEGHASREGSDVGQPHSAPPSQPGVPVSPQADTSVPPPQETSAPSTGFGEPSDSLVVSLDDQPGSPSAVVALEDLQPAAPPVSPWPVYESAVPPTAVGPAGQTHNAPFDVEAQVPPMHDEPTGVLVPGAKQAEAPVSAPRRRQRWRRVRMGAFACWSVALIGLGVVAAGWAHTQWGTEVPVPLDVTVQARAGLAGTGEGGAVVVPDLYGLTEQDAREALADAGLTQEQVTSVAVPAVGEPGRIVTQDPVRGTTDPGAVVLGVSADATMPDLAGRSLNEALAELEGIGARVIQDARYEPDVAVGSVVSHQPAPGEVAADTVTLVVAAPPSSIFAADVRSARSSCSSSSATIGGTTYDESMTCTVRSRGDAATIEYQVDGLVDEVRGTVGQAVSSSDPVGLRFRVLGDGGNELWARELRTGERAELNVRTTGHQQLTLEVTLLGEPEVSSVSAAFGDLTFVGSATAISGLAL